MPAGHRTEIGINALRYKLISVLQRMYRVTYHTTKHSISTCEITRSTSESPLLRLLLRNVCRSLEGAVIQHPFPP